MGPKIDNRPRPYACRHQDTCNKTFILKRDLTRHARDHNPKKTVKCSECIYSNSRTDAVNMHIKRVHRGVSNGRVRKQSKRRPMNSKTLVQTFQTIGFEDVMITIADRLFNDSVVKQELGIINSHIEDKNIKLENVNHNVVSYDCEGDEVYTLKEEVECVRRENIKLKHELRVKNDLLEEKDRAIISMRTAESALKESFDMALRNGSDYEGFLKERTEELAMSNKIRSSLKNQMREDGKEFEKFKKSLSESLASIKKAMIRDILTQNVFKTETVKDYRFPNMTISTEGFESYINQIFIRLSDKYFQCLKTIV
jgi:hypothetical protein